jgi:cytochrome c oxidase subunit 2
MSFSFPFFGVISIDAAESWQIGFQDPATPIIQGIIDFHHDVFCFIFFILGFVIWILGRTLWHFNCNSGYRPVKIVHQSLLEIIWTVAPSCVLIAIAIPSFALLYSIDEVVEPSITVKTIGHQWYWSYEYSDFAEEDSNVIVYDSYMIPEDDLELGQLRLLEVDNRVVLPVNTHIRFIITAADVLHSWAIPSLGIKCDAVPGRLNQVSLYLQRTGVFFGQCSELCGVNHGFMPIVIESVSLEHYFDWLSIKMKEDLFFPFLKLYFFDFILIIRFHIFLFRISFVF